jgi:tRNA pseudouridine32 synthase / 23S rRNA pseudouridine746 synthase
MSTPLFRWVTEAREPLAELLARHGLFHALPAGRVFVDRRRVEQPLELAPDSVVEVFAPRPSAAIQILCDEQGLFAVEKPAALPTEPDKSGSECVLSQLAESAGIDQRELFAVSRLDVGVSGVLLVATSEPSRQAILHERARGTLGRRYLALACGVPEPRHGEWRDGLGRGSRGKRVVDSEHGQVAHTRYRVVATAKPVARERSETSLLALSPVTGRTHQLRVHSAAHAAPLLGDRRYQGPVRMTAADGRVRAFAQVLLHAASVEWGPKGKRRRVVSEPPAAMVDTWLALEGDPSALQRALED